MHEEKGTRAERRWPYAPGEPGRELAAEPWNPACLLPPAELRERIQELREIIKPGILAIEELEDGYVYWFERTDEWFSRVTDFALFESRCCNFLDFEIGLQASGEKISLRIAGPGESKRFLANAFHGEIHSIEEV